MTGYNIKQQLVSMALKSYILVNIHFRYFIKDKFKAIGMTYVWINS